MCTRQASRTTLSVCAKMSRNHFTKMILFLRNILHTFMVPLKMKKNLKLQLGKCPVGDFN